MKKVITSIRLFNGVFSFHNNTKLWTILSPMQMPPLRGPISQSNTHFYRDFEKIPKQINPTELPDWGLWFFSVSWVFSGTLRKTRNALKMGHRSHRNCPNYNNNRNKCTINCAATNHAAFEQWPCFRFVAVSSKVVYRLAAQIS